MADNQAILNSVRQALALARIGVNADNRGDYSVAITNYREASNLLNSPEDLTALNDEHYQAMLEKSRQYQARADVLEALLNQSNGVVNSPAKENIVFVEETPSGLQSDPIPAFASYKPFWLMRVLSKTITGGAYLTPRLYIPKSVWQQTGCKLVAVQTKIQSLAEVSELISKLRSIASSSDSSNPVIDKKNIDNNSLHFHLSFIPEVKIEKINEKSWAGKMKKFGNSLAKGAVRLAPSSKIEGQDYVGLLNTVFEESQFLESWMNSCESLGNHSLATRLKRVGEFFSNVVCAFVMKDFTIMLDRYMRKSLQSYMKLKDIK
ncbi:microtubule interacting and transport domain-containing protein [Cavenderia fasciculata]|uniref:Microtubule interacting and transport domain-containing protein n=1 Tax=Cavenderia fasciculata TaxID=261658 RepID=F4PI95_CACFS|nr:microtubule interacting and transport domain-containing protein [Cavenderia fasciculata]EGG24529.1 microtubule interacting and transport domain-containing protein [Cavenderia fasciculata]|eukprot:XP_004362380.1 microtubule interacting and transport domain-containing protein [Cavenderia fasciculata]